MSVTPIDGYKWAAGIAYVAIPKDLSREEYIASCYKQGLISIRTEDGGFYNRVPVDKQTFNFIEFPETSDENGSVVVYITEPIHQQPMVVGIVSANNQLTDLKEHQFKFKRIFKDNFVEIVGSAKGGYVGINVDAENDAEVFININNQNKDAKLNINVSGSVEIHSSKDMVLSRYGEYMNETTDEEDESINSYHKQTVTTNEFQNEKFIINDGEEPITLGNSLKDILDDLFDLLSKATTVTMLGAQPLSTAVQIGKLKARTDAILSKVSFTD